MNILHLRYLFDTQIETMKGVFQYEPGFGGGDSNIRY